MGVLAEGWLLIVSFIRVCGMGDLGFVGVGRVCWYGVRVLGVWMVRRRGGEGEEGSGGKEWKRREGKWGRGELGKGEEEEECGRRWRVNVPAPWGSQ